MTEPHRAVITRLSTDFAALSQQFVRISGELRELERVLAVVPQPVPTWQPPHPHAGYAPTYAPPAAVRYPAAAPMPPAPPTAPPGPAPATPPPAQPRDDGWIGKVLAVAGVAVTLIGVVLLLVLAAQAGILRPEFRVLGGAALAGALVAVATRLMVRPGGRVGAIALAATGVAAAYIDLIAVTTIYEWVPAPVGLVLAAAVGGGGLTLARRWQTEHLALLVLVPLIALAPVVTDGVSLLLIGFMLALSAAALPVQLGHDWLWLHGARTAAPTVPLLIALAAAGVGSEHDLWLAGACGIAALLALAGALLVLPRTANRAGLAVIAGAGVLPVLAVPLAVDRVIAALMIGALAAALLGIVAVGDRLPGVAGPVTLIWSVLSAICALIAVNVAFDGEVAAPLLLAMALVVALQNGAGTAAAPELPRMSRWVAIGFAVVGFGLYLAYAPPSMLVTATESSVPDAVSILAASVLAVGAVAAIAWAGRAAGGREPVTASTVLAAGVAGYAVTMFAVTGGVLLGGTGGGFFAGHMAATICWMAIAAGLLRFAAHRPKQQRSVPIGGGLALVAAAMAKLFLFDLGTLDGIFRWRCSSSPVWCCSAWARDTPGCSLSRTMKPRCEPSHMLNWSYSRKGRVVVIMTNSRRTEAEIQGFQASTEMSRSLQRVLVDLIELQLQGKQAHWNVVGTNFRDLHLQLDEVVDFAREGSDTIAERMRALDAVPDGRSDTVAATTSLPAFPAYEHSTSEVVDFITTRINAAVDTMRSVHDAVDAEDPTTADILHAQIDGLEKLAWLIRSENRKV